MVCRKEDIIVVLPTGFGNSIVYIPEHNRKNASFHFHRFENVCSCGKFGSSKFQIEPNRTLVLPHSENQPSLTEKFDIVYGSTEQWFTGTLLTK